MKPIINPMWIYLADVSEVSKVLLLVLSVFLLIIGIVIYFGAEDLFFDADTEKITKSAKSMIVIGIISMFIGILLPKTETCYRMMAANLVTPDNVNYTKEQVIDFVDEITDAIEDKESK